MGVGQRASTVLAIVNADAYSRLRTIVTAASTSTIAPTAHRNDFAGALDLSAGAPNRRQRASAPMMTRITMQASGRYILRSAPTSAAMGTMLDVGASRMNTDTARKPVRGAFSSQTIDASTMAARNAAGIQTSASV